MKLDFKFIHENNKEKKLPIFLLLNICLLIGMMASLSSNIDYLKNLLFLVFFAN
jgi:hypothetical protein